MCVQRRCDQSGSLALGTTTALTISPRSGSGTPITACIGNAGTCSQHFFDVARIDVEARRDDQVFLAIDDAKEPVRIPRRQVARVEPAVADRAGRRLGIVRVAEHDLRSLDDHLADLTSGNFDAAVGRIDDPGVGIRQRQSDRPGASRSIERTDVRHGTGFGKSKSFDNGGSGVIGEFLGDSLIERRAAGNAVSQRPELDRPRAEQAC